MKEAERKVNFLADNILIMECPACEELVMISRNGLRKGLRVDCDHCGQPSTVSAQPPVDSDSSPWQLDRVDTAPDGGFAR